MVWSNYIIVVIWMLNWLYDVFLQGQVLPAMLFWHNLSARQALWVHFSARYTKSVATPALNQSNTKQMKSN